MGWFLESFGVLVERVQYSLVVSDILVIGHMSRWSAKVGFELRQRIQLFRFSQRLSRID